MTHRHLGARNVRAYMYFTLIAMTMAFVWRGNRYVTTGNLVVVLFYLAKMLVDCVLDKLRAPHSVKTNLYRFDHYFATWLLADNHQDISKNIQQYDLDQVELPVLTLR